MKQCVLSLVTFLVHFLFAAITITPTSQAVDKDGGGFSVLTGGSGTWTASTTASWITITPRTSGTAGTHPVVYIVDSNYTADKRTATIDISGNIHTVTQTGYDATISPTKASYTSGGGSGTITVTTLAGVSWTAKSNVSWITLGKTSGLGSGSLSYTVSGNADVQTRTGTITVAGNTFTVTQTGVATIISPTSSRLESSAQVLPVTVTALATTSWTATPKQAWITVVSGGSGTGGGTVNLAIASNPSWLERTGTVTIGSKTLTITQKGTTKLSFSVSPTKSTAVAEGANGSVAVLATPDAPWTAESLTSWLTLTDGKAGAGNGNIKYAVSPNTTLSSRTGTVKVTPPVVVPEFDLKAGLLFDITEQNNTEGNELRQTTYPLSKAFDGSFSNPLKGAAIPIQATNAYTLAFSFQVGALKTLNRLLKIGSHTVYLDDANKLHYHTLETSYTVSAAKSWYTVVLRVNAGHELKVWAGTKGSVLSCVGTWFISGYLDLNKAVGLSSFTLGYGTCPSIGNLGSGQLGNIRFWTRALNDEECKAVDTKASVMAETAPAGRPSGVNFDFFPLSGNMYGTDETSTNPKVVYDVVASNWVTSIGRDRVYAHGLRNLQKTGVVRVNHIGGLFDGSYTIASGTRATYGDKDNGVDYSEVTIGYDPLPKSGSEVDATYVVWFNMEERPNERVQILNRTLTRTQYTSASWNEGSDVWGQVIRKTATVSNAFATRNKNFAIWVDKSGYVVAEGSGIAKTTFSTKAVTTGDWHCLAVAAISEKSVRLYLDGAELGNVSSTMTLGYLPPMYPDGAHKGTVPSITDYGYFQVGGWKGYLDELTIYHKALTAAQVKAIYQAGLSAPYYYHTVTQAAAKPMLTPSKVTMTAAGGSSAVDVSLPAGVNWTAKANHDWITVTSGASGTGTGKVNFTVKANPAVTSRTGTLTIAGVTLQVVQSGLAATVTYDGKAFKAAGGSANVYVTAENNGTWTAKSNADWITVALGASGAGDGTVMFVVSPYNSPLEVRTGTLTIAGKTVKVTQRGYEMSITPTAADVPANSGSATIAVSAPNGAIWEAIASASWITITGGQSGTGSGQVTYSVAANTTGAVRTGTITIAGEVCQVKQAVGMVRTLTYTNLKGATHSNPASYIEGSSVTFSNPSAVAGYVFTGWTPSSITTSTKGNQTVTANWIVLTPPTIGNVTARQRYPWNGKVDISYTVTGDSAGYLSQGLVPTLKVTATDVTTGQIYTARSLEGATDMSVGTHAVIWDMAADGFSFVSANVRFTVACEMVPAPYCVVDLSDGASAASYPVTYLATEPIGGFATDVYRTTNLVLRCCNAGSFQMQGTTATTLARPFYMGVFEVTQKQWSLIMGTAPQTADTIGKGDGYPVYYVSYDMIRGSSEGSKWPSSATVDASSFLGKLQTRTKLDFDLPTEAQWEYACRAGSTTSCYWGDATADDYAWSTSNAEGSTHPVGMKKPNAWGLYDMSGNVWEWCLDWYGALSYGIDPIGPSDGSYRAVRGGGYARDISNCTSSYRLYCMASQAEYNSSGFRLARTVTPETLPDAVSVADSPSVRIDLSSSPRVATATETLTYSTEYWWLSSTPEGFECIANGGFEQSRIAANEGAWGKADGVQAETVHWYLTAGGVTRAATPWTTGADLPIGEFAAYLQGAASMQQTFIAPVFGTYELSFVSCARTTTALGHTFSVVIDGATLLEVVSNSGTGETHSKSVQLSAGLHTLQFIGKYQDGLDRSSVIDTVSLVLRKASDDVKCVISVTPVLTGVPETLIETAGKGTVDWTPTRVGLYFLTHTVSGLDGEKAWFTVPGPELVLNSNGSLVSGEAAVTIDGAEGWTVYYTTDGSEPTKTSTRYTGAITLDVSTTVKAVAYSATGIASQVVSQFYEVVAPEPTETANPVIIPADGSVFSGENCTVTITCATAGANIYYSTNGTTPRMSARFLYQGPFTITDTTTVKAVAVKDARRSDYVTSVITKLSLTLPLSLDVLDGSGVSLTTGGGAAWRPVVDAGAKVGASVAQSGAIEPMSETWLEARVFGAGTFAFWWRTDCEWDDSGDATWDHLAVFVNGEEAARIDGTTAWERLSFDLPAGENVIRWVYTKDDYDEEDAGVADCAWIDGIEWSGSATPVVTETQTTEVPVPFAWLKAKYPELADAAACEAKAHALAANGVNQIWECYVIGLDPTRTEMTFEAMIEMVNSVPKVTWRPDLGAERVYKILGSNDLKTWTEVSDVTKGAWRFFKVRVEMP